MIDLTHRACISCGTVGKWRGADDDPDLVACEGCGRRERLDPRSQRALTQAELKTRIASTRCIGCNVLGAWKVVNTDGRKRTLQCQGCGRRITIAV